MAWHLVIKESKFQFSHEFSHILLSQFENWLKDKEKTEEEQIKEHEEKRTLRSGKCYQVRIGKTDEELGNLEREGIWRKITVKKPERKDYIRIDSILRVNNIQNQFLFPAAKQK